MVISIQANCSANIKHQTPVKCRKMLYEQTINKELRMFGF